MTTTARQPDARWWRRLLRVELSLTVGEILAIAIIVTIIDLEWQNPPLWIFALAGVAIVVVPAALRRGPGQKLFRHQFPRKVGSIDQDYRSTPNVAIDARRCQSATRAMSAR